MENCACVETFPYTFYFPVYFSSFHGPSQVCFDDSPNLLSFRGGTGFRLVISRTFHLDDHRGNGIVQVVNLL